MNHKALSAIMLISAAACAAGGLMLASGCGTEKGPVVTDTDVDTGDDAAGDPDVVDEGDAADLADAEAPADVADAADADGDAGPDGTVVVEWEISVIDDSPAFKARAAIALGPDGSLHAAYNIATDPEGWYTPSVWYATNAGGSWTKQEASPADDISNEYPNLVVDSDGHPHIFYNRYNPEEEQIDIMHVTTDTSGNFTAPSNVTQTTERDEFAPDVFMDNVGRMHLVFQARTGTPELGYEYAVGYARVSGGATTMSEEVTGESAGPGLHPAYAVAVDGDGNVHTIYSKPGDLTLNTVLYYRKRNATGWEVEQPVTETDNDTFSPGIDVDGNGNVHVAYVKGPLLDAKTLSYDRLESGSWAGEQVLTASTEDRSYFLGLRVEDSGDVHIAYTRLLDSYGDLFYIAGTGGVFDEEYRVTETAELSEGTPSTVVDSNGTVYISFTENLGDAPNGVVYLATRREVIVP